MNFKSGALIAIAAGGLFAAACKKEDKGAGNTPAKDPAGEAAQPAVAPAETPAAPEKTVEKAAGEAGGEKVAKVDCYGVNECKGKSTCKTDKHGCGGQNECKGQGVTPLSEAECTEKGGKVINQ